MAVTHTCDACKKSLTANDRVAVDVFVPYATFELCKRCAAPILAFLKRRKLTPLPA